MPDERWPPTLPPINTLFDLRRSTPLPHRHIPLPSGNAPPSGSSSTEYPPGSVMIPFATPPSMSDYTTINTSQTEHAPIYPPNPQATSRRRHLDRPMKKYPCYNEGCQTTWTTSVAREHHAEICKYSPITYNYHCENCGHGFHSKNAHRAHEKQCTVPRPVDIQDKKLNELANAEYRQ